MAHSPSTSSRKSRKEGKDQFRTLQDEINRTVKPFPDIDVHETTLPPDVHEKVSRHRETPGGKVVKIVSTSSVGILTAITLYGMVSHDQAVLFGVLDVVRYTMVALLAWALGKTVTSLLSRGGRDDEKNEDSG